MATVGSTAQEPAAVAKQAAEANAIRAKLQVARVGVESRLTKNAPYSAEAVTESVQLLADGNRIVTKNTTHIFRDSEGRTRREQLNAAGTDVVSVNITDPSSGTTYVLDPASRTAYRNGLFVATWNALASTSVAPVGRGIDVTQTPDGAVVVTSRELEAKVAAEGQAATEAKATAEIKARTATPPGGGRGMSGSFATFDGGGFFPAKIAEAGGKTTQEDLGQQTIEGVIGHRHTDDNGDSRRSDWERTADQDRVGTVVLAGAAGPRSDEALRSPDRRNDVSPDRRRSRRTGAVALRSPARLHAAGVAHSAAAAVGGPEGPPSGDRATDVGRGLQIRVPPVRRGAVLH